MDKEGGERTMEALDGVQLKGSPRPLSVQPFIVVSEVLFSCLQLLIDTYYWQYVIHVLLPTPFPCILTSLITGRVPALATPLISDN
jgi:hypothetical protein